MENKVVPSFLIAFACLTDLISESIQTGVDIESIVRDWHKDELGEAFDATERDVFDESCDVLTVATLWTMIVTGDTTLHSVMPRHTVNKYLSRLLINGDAFSCGSPRRMRSARALKKAQFKRDHWAVICQDLSTRFPVFAPACTKLKEFSFAPALLLHWLETSHVQF